MTILNIDDDSEDLELFCEAIESIDPKIKCLTAQTPEQAFRLLDKTDTAPDHIFLDLNMPVKSSKECLKEIRKRPKLSNIPVVMFSTSKYIPDKEEYEKLGASFVVKESLYFDLVRSIKKSYTKIKISFPYGIRFFLGSDGIKHFQEF